MREVPTTVVVLEEWGGDGSMVERGLKKMLVMMTTMRMTGMISTQGPGF